MDVIKCFHWKEAQRIDVCKFSTSYVSCLLIEDGISTFTETIQSVSENNIKLE